MFKSSIHKVNKVLLGVMNVDSSVIPKQWILKEFGLLSKRLSVPVGLSIQI